MFKVYKSFDLAAMLDRIALGDTYSADALYAAKKHDVTTRNDYLMIDRWLYGEWTSTDSHDLQQLAIQIRESGLDAKYKV